MKLHKQTILHTGPIPGANLPQRELVIAYQARQCGKRRHTCQIRIWAGSRGLSEDGATFVHKVKSRQLAVEHHRGVVAELKSKKNRTTKKQVLPD
jgi:hypothetical protein